MPTSTVVRLDELRARRAQRLRLALAMHRTDEERLRIAEHLAEFARLVGADRVGAVWIDEYGPGLVHPHTVIDLLSDAPRRRFAPEPLRLAWSDGVPGKVDIPDAERSGPIPIHDAARSLCAVALGSDGSKAWFLVADGLDKRVPLDRETSGQLMFVAGECAGVLLHRDLPVAIGAAPRQRFAGWPVLRDIEGREEDEAVSRRIGARFLVARQLRALVDDDFAVAPGALSRQLQAVARELTRVSQEEPERARWEEVLGALDRGDWRAVAAASIALGGDVEDQGHLHGACELYCLAHRAAVVAGAVSETVESARLLGRWYRRQGEWDEAIRWYEGARAVAALVGDRATESIVLDGLASAVRDKGNLPRARDLLRQGLEAATESEDDYALASFHHTLMTVERLSGRLPQAVVHGWRAVNLHRDQEHRCYALVSLAACFLDMRELDAAENAYTIVAQHVERLDWRFASLEMLAHVAALRGDRAVFEERVARAEGAGWRGAASTPVHAQILRDRGLSWRALGELDAARTWLTRAREHAEEHGVNQVSFECEAALAQLDDTGAHPNDASATSLEQAPADSDPFAAEMAEVKGGVEALRRALAPA